MARIDRFASRAQADLAAGFLTANGIRAWVSGDDAGGARPDIVFGIGGTVVEVDDAAFDEAVALLDEAFDPQPSGRWPADLVEGTDDRRPGSVLRVVVIAMLAAVLLAVVLSVWPMLA